MAVFFLRKPVNTFFPCLNFRDVKIDTVQWQDGGAYNTTQYSSHDAFTIEFIQYTMEQTKPVHSVLDIGCNQGRFLKTLSENGYTELYGIDVMCNAIDVLNDYSSKNGNKIKSVCGLVQAHLPSLDDKSIDYFITYSATIELIHPNFDLFAEMKRICRVGFIFALNENGHTYPRFYRLLAMINGFRNFKIFKLGNNLTVLHFIK